MQVDGFLIIGLKSWLEFSLVALFLWEEDFIFFARRRPAVLILSVSWEVSTLRTRQSSPLFVGSLIVGSLLGLLLELIFAPYGYCSLDSLWCSTIVSASLRCLICLRWMISAVWVKKSSWWEINRMVWGLVWDHLPGASQGFQIRSFGSSKNSNSWGQQSSWSSWTLRGFSSDRLR